MKFCSLFNIEMELKKDLEDYIYDQVGEASVDTVQNVNEHSNVLYEDIMDTLEKVMESQSAIMSFLMNQTQGSFEKIFESNKQLMELLKERQDNKVCLFSKIFELEVDETIRENSKLSKMEGNFEMIMEYSSSRM